MRVIILDTETTGLKDSRPVEVAYIDVSELFNTPMVVSGSRRVFEYRQLFNPMQSIEFGAMATHHITNQDVADSDPYTTFELPKSIEYMIGHNIDFDWQVIQSCGTQPEPKRICTLAMSRYLHPEIDSHKLTAMLYALDYDFARENATSAHSALDDVWMTLRLLELLLPLTQATNFEDLYQFSEMTRIPKIITFGEHEGKSIQDLPYSYAQWLLKEDGIDPYLKKAIELCDYPEESRIPTVMTFGKHKGMSISSLPHGYKQWLLNQSDLDPYLRKALINLTNPSM